MSLGSAAKFLIKNMGRKAGLEISLRRKRGQESLPGYVEDDFKALYQKYCHQSVVPWSGLYAAYRGIKHIACHDIQGAIVECGVFKGGCSALMAEALSSQEKDIYLFDTFEGMSAPTEDDAHFTRAHNAHTMFKKLQYNNSIGSNWVHGPIDIVKNTMAQTGHSSAQIHYIQGMVEETLTNPENLPEKIALLRLDTDWYESTKIEMDVLYPRLQSGGILIIDDYGTWTGAYKAVHEYIQNHNLPLFLNVDTSYGGAVAIKP